MCSCVCGSSYQLHIFFPSFKLRAVNSFLLGLYAEVMMMSHMTYCSRANSLIRESSQYLPSHLGMGPLHMTFPFSSWQEMVSAPWVLIKPSSQTTEMELPSWKLSPKRRALIGMPGSGHSLWPNAGVQGDKETDIMRKELKTKCSQKETHTHTPQI